MILFLDFTDDNRSSSPMSARDMHGQMLARRDGYLTPSHFARSASLGVAGRTPINPIVSNPNRSSGIHKYIKFIYQYHNICSVHYLHVCKTMLIFQAKNLVFNHVLHSLAQTTTLCLKIMLLDFNTSLQILIICSHIKDLLCEISILAVEGKAKH